MDIIGIDPNDRMGPYALDNARRFGIIPKKVRTPTRLLLLGNSHTWTLS
jgi:hypothetical protein